MLFVCSYILNHSNILKFCTEHDSPTAMLCAKIQMLEWLRQKLCSNDILEDLNHGKTDFRHWLQWPKGMFTSVILKGKKQVPSLGGLLSSDPRLSAFLKQGSIAET